MRIGSEEPIRVLGGAIGTHPVSVAGACDVSGASSIDGARTELAGVPARRVGVGVADQVGLVCKVSPVTAARRVNMARTLVAELPETYGLLSRGQVSGWVATLVVRETQELSPADRRRVDSRLAAALGSMSPRQAEAAARRAAVAVDAASVVRRGRTARSDRRVSIRPAPDTMALVCGFVPCEQGVAAWAALDRDARTQRATGDPRSIGQIMADTFIQRLTGQATAAAVPVEIGLTLPADALLDGSDDRPAELTGHGPVPAQLAREIAGMDSHEDKGPSADEMRNSRARCGNCENNHDRADRARVFVRRILTDPVDSTVVAVDTRRRRFDGPLARLIAARDQHCRMPYCPAPIRHLDHIVAYRDGGPTSVMNGQGLCERHSYTKEAPGWHMTVTDPGPVADPGHADGPGLADEAATSARGHRRPHTTIITTPTGHTYQSQAPPVPG